MNMKGTIKKKSLGVLAIAGALAVIVWAVGCRKNGNSNAGVSSTVSTTGSASKAGFSAEFRTEPSEVAAGKPTKLIISIKDANGAVVRDLDLSHEKPLHLIVVSSDLSQFYHVHPESQPQGTYRGVQTFANSGHYKLYADFTPPNGSQVVEAFDLNVTGLARSSVALVPDSTATKTEGGLRVTLQPDKPLRSGDEVMLNFAIFDERTGTPVTDLQRYLGAPAHVVIISGDTNDYLHVHPTEKGKVNHDTMAGMKEMEGMDHSKAAQANGEARPISSEISAHTTFPRRGLYKVWAQFQRGGRVITVPFVLSVAAGSPGSDRE